jgi:predicted  nucleic acid-binding Zn-ribbon protein
MLQEQDSDRVVESGTNAVAISRMMPTPILTAPNRVVRPEPDIAPANDIISRAGALIVAQRQHAAVLEQRAAEAEARLGAAVQRIAATELQLRSALEELQRERDRSGELLGQTQAMLDEASDRLVAAEARAEALHGALSTLLDVVEHRLGPEIEG